MDFPDSFITIFITINHPNFQGFRDGKQTSPGIDLELLASFGLESLAGLEQMDQAKPDEKLMKAELIF
jgi:hypothetical protein